MEKRLLMVFVTLLLTALTVQAVPAKPGVKKTVKLADGSTIELTLRGDEHYSYYTDASGAPFQIEKGIARKITPEEVTTQWTARKRANLNRAAASRRAGSITRRIGEPSASTTGTHRSLVVLLEFQDVKFTTPNVRETYQRVFNEADYHEGGMTGSVRDYFLKQSYNQLTIDFDVAGPYTVNEVEKYYGEPIRDEETGEVKFHDRDPSIAIVEALDQAIEDKSLNFADYDWDGDGVVDQVFFIFAGYSEAQGADENTIWPHENTLIGYGWDFYLEDDEGNRLLVFDTYACASELCDDGKPDENGNIAAVMDGIGTACHEFSHCLGLPDMYDTDFSGGFGMSYWDIMDQGAYIDNARTPAGYSSYERWFSGWLEPVEIKEMTSINDMKPLATYPEAYVLYNEATEKSIKGEYYLLENRQRVDFDAKLNGHGLMIIHVDYDREMWTNNEVNDDPDHQRLTIIPADGELSEASKEALAGDLWPGYKKNTALTNTTTPAAELFNPNVDGRKLMSKPIEDITEDVDAKTVSFQACRPIADKIDAIVTNSTDTPRYYDLQGREVPADTKGLLIRKLGSSVEKVTH